MSYRFLPRHWPLWLQLGVPVTGVIIFAVGLVAFLNYFNFQKSYGQLTQERYLVLGKDARQVIEAGLSAGLDPALNQGLVPFFEQLRRSAPGLRFLTVLNSQGRTTIGSGNVPPGGTWMVKPAAHEWHQRDAQLHYLGLPFRNSFGVTVGTLVVAYENAGMEADIKAMRARLLRLWLQVSLAVALVAPLCLWLLTRKMSVELNQAAAAIDHALDETIVPMPAMYALGEELAEDIPQFIQLSRQAARQSAPDEAAFGRTKS